MLVRFGRNETYLVWAGSDDRNSKLPTDKPAQILLRVMQQAYYQLHSSDKNSIWERGAVASILHALPVWRIESEDTAPAILPFARCDIPSCPGSCQLRHEETLETLARRLYLEDGEDDLPPEMLQPFTYLETEVPESF